MSPKSFRGNPEELIQLLTDEIDKLKERINDLNYRIYAHRNLFIFTGAALSSIDPMAYATFQRLILELRDGHRECSKNPDVKNQYRQEERDYIARAFNTMAEELDGILIGTQEPERVTLSVLKGGKFDE